MSGRLHVATRKGLFTVERKSGGHGPRWEVTDVSLLAQPVSAVLHDPRDGTLYAALNLGHFGVKLRRSENGGRDWTECAVPVYPPAADAETGPSLVMIWILEGAGPDQPDSLWAGTLPGGLFRSDDRGDSWQLVESLWNDPLRPEWVGGGADHPGIHSVCVDPRDSRHVTIGISCGGVWDTRDNGASWTLEGRGMYAEYMPPEKRDYPNTQDPHRLVQCPADPDGCWVQHHNGIFASRDGGRTFRSCENALPSKFGFAVVVHPRDPNTAWFVPAVKDETRVPVDGRVVVSRTRDGGETFEVLGNGLPDKHAYDLTYRHALDIDGSGDRLAFGTTTGSLWVSEDQGDRWETISQHLPPVYAVRFAVTVLLFVLMFPAMASARWHLRHHGEACNSGVTSEEQGADNQLTAAERAAGWQLLFNGVDTSGWKTNTGKPVATQVENGCLLPHGCGGSMLMHERKFGDFVLACDVKLTDDPEANSGVFFRVADPQDPIYTGFEVQCGYPGTEYNSFGAIYSLVRPTKNAARPNTEWNHLEIKCQGPMTWVKLNGELVATLDADQFDRAGLRPDGSEHKFKQNVVKTMPRVGYLGFQDHSTPVYVKNVKLLELK